MIKIIIVSKDQDSCSIGYIIKFFEGYEIYLLSPKASQTKYKYKYLIKINDNDILNYKELKKNLQIDNFGWYYQQFLKYHAVLSLEGDEFLVIDGDSIISDRLVKSDTLFTTTKKTNEKYSNLYKELFPAHKLNGMSFITNQMIFKKGYLKEIITEIEKIDTGSWIEIVTDLVKKNKDFMFSEYQVYAEYLLNKKDNINIDKVSVFRRMDLISDSVENALLKYNILAYEDHHRTGLLRLIRAKIYYYFGKSIG